jgi:hypothetical protein
MIRTALALLLLSSAAHALLSAAARQAIAHALEARLTETVRDGWLGASWPDLKLDAALMTMHVRAEALEAEIVEHAERLRGASGSASAEKIDLPVYYVNMDRHVDRRAWMEAQFAALRPPIAAVRVPGVDGELHMDRPVHSGFD